MNYVLFSSRFIYYNSSEHEKVCCYNELKLILNEITHSLLSSCCRRYFPAFLTSSFYCKHQIDILTSGKVFLSDILYNPNAMFYFMEVSGFFLSYKM